MPKRNILLGGPKPVAIAALAVLYELPRNTPHAAAWEAQTSAPGTTLRLRRCRAQGFSLRLATRGRSGSMLSVVIPAFDEEEGVGQTVRAAREALSAHAIGAFEIIVVDDGSSDRTSEIAAAEGARVVRHLHNLGYGRSVKDGIEAARYPAIAIADADGTYPVQDLPRLFALYQQGYHMVVGSRTGEHYRGSFVKSPLRWILQHLVEFTASRKIPDINSGLRIFSRDHALAYFDRLCDTFSLTTSLTLAFMMNGLYVTYVPVEYHQRIGRSKVRLFRDSVKTLQYVSEAAVYYNPLRIFMLVSGLLLIASVLLILVNFSVRSNGLFYIAIGCVLMSIQVFISGLMLTLLKQILHRQSGPPETDRSSAARPATPARKKSQKEPSYVP